MISWKSLFIFHIFYRRGARPQLLRGDLTSNTNNNNNNQDIEKFELHAVYDLPPIKYN